MLSHGIYSVILLIFSNVFMTFAWYGHLKMRQEFSWFAALPLIGEGVGAIFAGMTPMVSGTGWGPLMPKAGGGRWPAVPPRERPSVKR